MNLITTIRNYNGTIYVRIPQAFVEYFRLKQIETDECKIEEMNDKAVKITFPKW